MTELFTRLDRPVCTVCHSQNVCKTCLCDASVHDESFCDDVHCGLVFITLDCLFTDHEIRRCYGCSKLLTNAEYEEQRSREDDEEEEDDSSDDQKPVVIHCIGCGQYRTKPTALTTKRSRLFVGISLFTLLPSVIGATVTYSTCFGRKQVVKYMMQLCSWWSMKSEEIFIRIAIEQQ